MKQIHFIDALPGSGKSYTQFNQILQTEHKRHIVACKGIIQINSAINNELKDADAVVIPIHGESELNNYDSITEQVEKLVRSISQSDSRKYIILITHAAYDMFKSVSFLNNAGFRLVYDEYMEPVVDLSVRYDNLSSPEAIRVINKDNTVRPSSTIKSMLDSDYKLRNQSNETKTLIYYCDHPRYEVSLVTTKEYEDDLVEYYQARIKENYLMNDTTILAYGIINSSLKHYLKNFNIELTEEQMAYDQRDNKIIVIPMTTKRNTHYLQTNAQYKATYDRMIHRMIEIANTKDGKVMAYTNKCHDHIIDSYDKIAKLPKNLHSLNKYSEYNVLVNTFCSNRSTESIMGLTEVTGMSYDELLTERTRDALIQATNRGINRNREVSGGVMYSIVVSLEDAEHIARTLPNVAIDMSVIDSGEFAFIKAEYESKAISTTDRLKIQAIKKNHKNKKLPKEISAIIHVYMTLKGRHFIKALEDRNLWDRFSTVGNYRRINHG